MDIGILTDTDCFDAEGVSCDVSGTHMGTVSKSTVNPRLLDQSVSRPSSPGTPAFPPVSKPAEGPYQFFPLTSDKFSIFSVLKCVFTIPLAAKSKHSIASLLVPTATAQMFACLNTSACGKLFAIGCGAPSGIPMQTRVPSNRRKSNACA